MTDRLVGASPAHVATLDQLHRIAASEATTLIEGETGSGKELAARSIHYGGPRRDGPFVPVNCGAIPDALIEAELFGHERGAFTDAWHARRGLVAEASEGSLFLDEVDALSPKGQVTLLRFLQDRRYRPVGTAREMRADVRVIAAANHPLEALSDRGAFRVDLLYRLKILHLVMPPLREREDDALLLAEHFIERFAAIYRAAPKSLHPATRDWVVRHPWPGNVRELENWVHRQFLMTRGEVIVHEGDGQPAAPSRDPVDLESFSRAKAEAVRLFERAYLSRALQLGKGCVTRAARIAGKERRAFGKLLKKHGLAAQSESSAVRSARTER